MKFNYKEPKIFIDHLQEKVSGDVSIKFEMRGKNPESDFYS